MLIELVLFEISWFEYSANNMA